MLSGIGAAAAALTVGARRTAAQTVGGFEPERHPQDAWLNQVPGRHRTIVDCAQPNAAAGGLLAANNFYDANRSGYQLADKDLAVVVCLRHFATVFAYNDAMWAKYGAGMSAVVQFTDPRTKQAPSKNLLMANGYGPLLPNAGVTLQQLAARGTQFAVCNVATREIAGAVARRAGLDARMVYDDFVANLIPNSHLMAAGVVAVNRAQEYGYTLLTVV